MGWVNDRFRDDSDYENLVPQLWNTMRDSVGIAVQEFNKFTSDMSGKYLRSKDCSAMGMFCRRVYRNSGGADYLEVFLQEDIRALKTSNGASETLICGYRLKEDRSTAEFVLDKAEGPTVISADEACRLALESFIFPVSKSATA